MFKSLGNCDRQKNLSWEIDKTYTSLLFVIGIVGVLSLRITDCDRLIKYHYHRDGHDDHQIQGFVRYNIKSYRHDNHNNGELRDVECATSEETCSHPGTMEVLDPAIYQPKAILRTINISIRRKNGHLRSVALQIPIAFKCIDIGNTPHYSQTQTNHVPV